MFPADAHEMKIRGKRPKYEGKSEYAARLEQGCAKGKGISFEDSLWGPGVIIILALCNSGKLFTSY